MGVLFWEVWGNLQYFKELYKNAFENKIIFEEINYDWALKFSYQWNFSDKFGFIKKSSIANQSVEEISLSLLDGIQNLLPFGVEQSVQNSSSNLVDAYKKCELESNSGVGIFSLSAIILDRAEPSEALKANIVWSSGLDQAKKLLCSKQLDTFRRGGKLTQEEDVKAEKVLNSCMIQFQYQQKKKKMVDCCWCESFYFRYCKN